MSFVIEKGVKMPESRGSTRYPFREMEIGDSFFVPTDEPSDIVRIRSAASHMKRQHGLVFACRAVCENGKAGIRVWRTK